MHFYYLFFKVEVSVWGLVDATAEGEETVCGTRFWS